MAERVISGICAIVIVTAVATLGAAAGSGVSLIDAVKGGNRSAVRTLIAQKSNVNVAEPDGMTPLHWAVRGGDVDMAGLLLRAGANAKAANRYGITPILLAAENGDARLVQMLVKAGADPNSRMPEGQTALMTAARTGSADAIKVLVEAGADVNAREDWQGQTALMWAAAHNNAAAVTTLIALGADRNAKSKLLSFPEFKWETSGMVTTILPRGGWTPLMYAARDGALEAAAALADARADLNVTDPDGTTALAFAIINAHFDTAKVLVEKGADPNIADVTGTAALYAAVDMHTMAPMLSRPAPKLVDKIDAGELVNVLLAHGANPNARLKRPTIGRHHLLTGDASLGEGTTPLMRAAKSNDIAVMKALLDAGADPSLTLKDRTTPLMVAAGGGAVVGAYANAIPVTEDTSIQAIRFCLERGVDVNAFNTNGQTALHLAVQRGAEKVVRFLAQNGAKLDMKNKQGRTPLDVALGVGGGGRGAARGRGATAPKETMVALLRELMGQPAGAAQ
jgi:ankyrin repeat protein